MFRTKKSLMNEIAELKKENRKLKNDNSYKDGKILILETIKSVMEAKIILYKHCLTGGQYNGKDEGKNTTAKVD